MALKDSERLNAPTKSAEGLVDIAEAARVLSVSVSTLYGWVWQRKIAFVKMGRAVRFEQSVLREFIDQNRVQPRRIAKF
jgi:excisionase family DNA binding protein